MSTLTEADIPPLARLLTKSFTFTQWQDVVGVATGEGLFDFYAGPALPLYDTIATTLRTAVKMETAAPILVVAYRQSPLKPALRAEIARIKPDVVDEIRLAPPDAEYQAGPPGQRTRKSLQGSSLESIVKAKNPNINPEIWGVEFYRMTRLVCRIDLGENALGTGFLVGPRSVLTNWHVVEKAVAAGTIHDVRCRFDFRILKDGAIDSGVTAKLGPAGIVFHRPYSQAEGTLSPDKPPPDRGDLDYALLDLAEALGSERGWIAIPTKQPAPAPQDGIIIAQHPAGRTIKYAIDSDGAIGFVHDGLRLRYTTNTEEGSSGSPCFLWDWSLAGLHHLGDPAFQEPLYNQAVPICLVRDSIVNAGHGSRLG